MSSGDQHKNKPTRAGGRVVRNKPKAPGNDQSTSVSKWRRASDVINGEEEIDESEQCIICANRIEYAAISPCTHRTCHTCTFRQRALYQKKNCLICRTENERVIITVEIHENYESFQQKDFTSINDEYGIDFTSNDAKVATLSLLDYACPIKNCKAYREHTKFKNFKQLNEHVKSEHDRYFCDICAFNKKAFISELKLYLYRDLQRHKSKGDNDGFKGHPLCQFCSGKRFYSDDELFIHLRGEHEKCHVCDQIDSSNPQYFKNYDSLSEHFRNEHYVCTVQSCLDQKFVVFADDFDLKAHMIKEHKNIFGGDKNLLSFGNIGYTNQRRNGFGSELSTFRPTNNNNNNNNNNNYNGNSNSRSNDRQNRGTRDNDEGERDVDSVELKKMRLEERARHYSNYNSALVEKFKKINKDYEDYKIEADALVKAYEELFTGLTNEDLGILIYELSELFEANSIRRKRLIDIRADLNSGNSREEQFPVLPGTSHAYTFTRGSWNKAQGSSNGSSKKKINEDFPALPNPEQAPKLNHKVISYKKTLNAPTAKPTPVVKKANNVTNLSSYKNSYLSGSTVSSSSSSAALNDQSFPALPTVQVKRPPRVNPIRVDSGVWGTGSGGNSASGASPVASNNSSALDLSNMSESLPGQSGKKKKKKQLLFHVGI